jgi:hypothetical protein
MQIPVFQFSWTCWKCNEEMTVTYPTDINVFNSEFRGNLARTYSKTLEEYVVGNICPICGAYQGNFFISNKFLIEYSYNLEEYFVGFIDLLKFRCIICEKIINVPSEKDKMDLSNINEDLILQSWQDYEDRINQFTFGYPDKEEAIRIMAHGQIAEFLICNDCFLEVKDEINEERLRQLREKPLIVCKVCKKSNKDDTDIQFVQHHISYDPEEIITVCASCHSKIHHSSDYQEFRPRDKRIPKQPKTPELPFSVKDGFILCSKCNVKFVSMNDFESHWVLHNKENK